MNRSIGGFIALCLFLLTSTASLAGDRALAKRSGTAPVAACCLRGDACCGASCPTAGCR